MIEEEWRRLAEARSNEAPWRKWGPYLSERQWGTVREDDSALGDVWNSFTHDEARSRAYRWGEDGIAGLCDEEQRLCFALALWNGADPILKERLFGLNNNEGNHGEDVKEYYYYLDSTPTHSYMKYLYKYCQSEYPYNGLTEENKKRGPLKPEFELEDTGVFDDRAYFDVFVEYAKAEPEDILIQISAINRGSSTATLHLLPTLWFRNGWRDQEGMVKPVIRAGESGTEVTVLAAADIDLGARYLYCEGNVPLLFTNNESNLARLKGTKNRVRYVKDGINDFVVSGQSGCVNPLQNGTKAAMHAKAEIAAGATYVMRLRLTARPPSTTLAPVNSGLFGDGFERVISFRRKEADAFYRSIIPTAVGGDQAQVMRQALSGMLWSKQFYFFDGLRWLGDHGPDPQGNGKAGVRNRGWSHLFNKDIISMPDKWEYPWYAAWDLAFHAIPLALVDPDLAKAQLELMLNEAYMRPDGQVPAYEWNFDDVTPPVHAWAAHFTYTIDKAKRGGVGDLSFLQMAFQKLLMNYTWWSNRRDSAGRSVFAGGFLGLDNIGVLDPAVTGSSEGALERSDGLAWMGFYAASMMTVALELTGLDAAYEEMASKFLDNYLWLASAMEHLGGEEEALWDDKDGFFYEIFHLPDQDRLHLKVRSIIGLIPLCAVAVLPEDTEVRLPRLGACADRFFNRYPELLAKIQDPRKPSPTGRRLLSVLNEDRLRRVLGYLLDEKEFLSPFGIRSLSLHHIENPCVVQVGQVSHTVEYEPGEPKTALFGGNANWRGPIWFPLNVLIIRALLTLYLYYGNLFTVECPVDSGRMMTLYQVAETITRRLIRIFVPDETGHRPVFGESKLLRDPHFRDHILFYEYFHGENGSGLGASHQTGWTGLVATLIQMFATQDADQFLKHGMDAVLNPGVELKRKRRKF